MNELVWYAVGSIAAILTSFAFVPQVMKMWRTRSVRDISPLTLGQFAAGVSLWTIYGAHLGDPVIIAADLITLSTLTLGLVLYFRFLKREWR
jgi:MtN3 and saliva related transmembrane protein